MALSIVEFSLQNGYIDHWLVAGPQVTPTMPGGKKGPESRSAASSLKSGITKMPLERGPLEEGTFQIGGYTGSWTYRACQADHYVDLSTSQPVPSDLRAWTYTQLNTSAAQTAVFTVDSCGPFDLWLNDHHLFHGSATSSRPQPSQFQVDLQQGSNEVLVRLENQAAPAGLLVLGLRVQAAGDLKVAIPTLMPSISRRNELEAVYQSIYLDRDVYSESDLINLCWPDRGEKSAFNDVYFKGPSGMFQAQASDVGKPGDSLFLGYARSSEEGASSAVVMPLAWEYYDANIRIDHQLHAAVVSHSQFSARPYGSLAERQKEALSYAARSGAGVFADLARAAAGDWKELDLKGLAQAALSVQERQPGCELTALALAGLVTRFGSKPDFPQSVKKQVKDCLVQFNYDPRSAIGEGEQILLIAAEILAAQLYPDHPFAVSGFTGLNARPKAVKRALQWLQQHGRLGFAAWDSPSLFAAVFTALAHLVDLARDEAVWELASVLLDKLLFAMALNSFQGAFASSRGFTHTSELKSSLLEPTSGISRVLWGLGIFNQHLAGAVSAALLRKYELPENIAQIASYWPEELWSLEQQAAAEPPVNKVMYRTPNAMLCSAQSYRPGQPGAGEHIWQATLGPRSVVFTNHPACMSEKEEHLANFWRGNASLPRVAQWKDNLVALYQLPADDRLGFTHAYFPALNFDEYVLRDGWAFARQGHGYLALTAACPIELLREGPTAYRELRSYGAQNAWLCQLGGTVLDGDFTAFQEKVLHTPVRFADGGVQWQTLRGEALSFGWQAPFLLNGLEQPLQGFKHFENPYCTAELPCQEMEISTIDYTLRLDFSG